MEREKNEYRSMGEKKKDITYTGHLAKKAMSVSASLPQHRQ